LDLWEQSVLARTVAQALQQFERDFHSSPLAVVRPGWPSSVALVEPEKLVAEAGADPSFQQEVETAAAVEVVLAWETPFVVVPAVEAPDPVENLVPCSWVVDWAMVVAVETPAVEALPFSDI